jgi:hypothetical protein
LTVKQVERSIRLIDQAIQEQEHAIFLGARSGTRLAPILLPELSVPKWTKPARVTLSPDPDDAFDGAQTKAPAPRRKKSKKGRKKDPLPSEAVVPLPRPKPPVIPNADPNEKRYCYCDQVSFGEVRAYVSFTFDALTGKKMIACDDPRCEREWVSGVEVAYVSLFIDMLKVPSQLHEPPGGPGGKEKMVLRRLYIEKKPKAHSMSVKSVLYRIYPRAFEPVHYSYIIWYIIVITSAASGRSHRISTAPNSCKLVCCRGTKRR